MKNVLRLTTLAILLAVPAVGFAGDGKKCDPKDAAKCEAKCDPKDAAKCEAKMKAGCCDAKGEAAKKAAKPAEKPAKG
jgi:hypothetical protein